MGNVVMPKNSADLDALIPILNYYYEKNDWVDNATYIQDIKHILLEKGIDNEEKEPQHYTKRMQVLSYYGFIEWKNIDDSQSNRRITQSGKQFYEAVSKNDKKEISKLLLNSLESVVFGRNNCGVPSSDSDIEAPSLCIRAILDLNYIEKEEFAYILYFMQDNGFTYSTLINKIRENRNKKVEIVLPEDAKKYTDWKPIIFLERFYFLQTVNSKTYINSSILQEYENRLKCLVIYNIDKNKTIEKTDFHAVIKKPPFSHNRIVFGAPGTGKSFTLEEDRKKCFADSAVESSVSEEEIVRNELANIGNNYSKCFALGFTFASFFKGKKPKFIKENYGCNPTAAYITSQGARCSDFYKTLQDCPDEEITVDIIKKGLAAAESEKYLKEAGSAAVGRKYSSYLYGKSVSEICSELGLVETQTQSTCIWYGVQSVDYSFDEQKEEIKKYYERVTFHPNYSYAHFVGTYKPVQDSEDPDKIRYEYVPGPFMRIYSAAKKDQKNNYLLLIEEINRANVAAVFGDVFQLLDRKDGVSEYPVAASEDVKKYLKSKGIEEDELSIPANMYIWATMNSADQGVFPIDTAFKRRWAFEYIGIDDAAEKESFKDYEIPISENKKVKWNDLRKAINNKLISLCVNEDKLLGLYFISKNVLDSAMDKKEDFIKLFKNKVLMYLFEDAAKMKAKQLFKFEKNCIYSEVCDKFDTKGVDVFNFLDGVNVVTEPINPENAQADGE